MVAKPGAATVNPLRPSLVVKQILTNMLTAHILPSRWENQLL
jgi:hypothetical protein